MNGEREAVERSQQFSQSVLSVSESSSSWHNSLKVDAVLHQVRTAVPQNYTVCVGGVCKIFSPECLIIQLYQCMQDGLSFKCSVI